MSLYLPPAFPFKSAFHILFNKSLLWLVEGELKEQARVSLMWAMQSVAGKRMMWWGQGYSLFCSPLDSQQLDEGGQMEGMQWLLREWMDGWTDGRMDGWMDGWMAVSLFIITRCINSENGSFFSGRTHIISPKCFVKFQSQAKWSPLQTHSLCNRRI